jgi:hypothetical protein
MLKQFGMDNSTATLTPEEITTTKRIQQIEQEETYDNVQQYQSMVGALLYAAMSTRPDIAHAVGMLSRHLSNPKPSHVIAAKRVMKYLRGTTNMGLTYKGSGNIMQIKHGQHQYVHMEGYSDADWAGDATDRKSTTGYVVHVNGNVVSWGMKKQPTIALSTAEAEYMAISLTVQEILWIKQLLKEMMFQVYNTSESIKRNMNQEVHQVSPHAVPLWCDNQAAIAISNNDVHHQRTKHIDIRHHYVRDMVKRGEIVIAWIPTEKQIADVLTKALGSILYTRLRNGIVSVVDEQQNGNKEEKAKQM